MVRPTDAEAIPRGDATEFELGGPIGAGPVDPVLPDSGRHREGPLAWPITRSDQAPPKGGRRREGQLAWPITRSDLQSHVFPPRCGFRFAPRESGEGRRDRATQTLPGGGDHPCSRACRRIQVSQLCVRRWRSCGVNAASSYTINSKLRQFEYIPALEAPNIRPVPRGRCCDRKAAVYLDLWCPIRSF